MDYRNYPQTQFFDHVQQMQAAQQAAASQDFWHTTLVFFGLGLVCLVVIAAYLQWWKGTDRGQQQAKELEDVKKGVCKLARNLIETTDPHKEQSALEIQRLKLECEKLKTERARIAGGAAEQKAQDQLERAQSLRPPKPPTTLGTRMPPPIVISDCRRAQVADPRDPFAGIQ